MVATPGNYDYIVVGGGSAGSVVAARLSESGRHRVLLLEAGPDDQTWSLRNFFVQMPLGYAKSYNDRRVNWRYHSEPNPGLGGRSVYVPRGRILGGSSSINALVYVQGQPQDYDGWEALGNPGWGAAEVRRLYRKLEMHPYGPSEHHGDGGPLGITDLDGRVHPLCAHYLNAASELGLKVNPDYNGESQEGVAPYQATLRHGRRASASRSYLWPARHRPNLRIVTHARATRILFEGLRAVGVAYSRHGRPYEARATGEVILAAGAVNTPKLLQLSGVGSGLSLALKGVAVQHDLPGVGRNLQDHVGYDHYYVSRVPSMNEALTSLFGQLSIGIQYVLLGRGWLSMTGNHAGGFIRSRGGLDRPNMQLYFCPFSYEKAPAGSRKIMIPDEFPGFSLTVSPCRPSSRGSVEIVSADPKAPPKINLNLLATPDDVSEILEGARIIRRFADTKTFQSIIERERLPGPQVKGDEALIDDIRKRSYSIFHPSGSCMMGPDPKTAVVDARLRVHGLASLRVIDASIFPTIPSGNINGPTIMVAEKGAEMILEDRLTAVAGS